MIARLARPALAGTALLLLSALPGAASDPQDGRRIAERWCAACHVVSKEQVRGQDGVPSFATIGAREGLDERSLAAFLASPHPAMPDMALSRPETAALVAWIKAQGGR